MDIISILGLGLGLAVLIMMGFKGWGMIPTNRRVFTWKGGELGHPGAYSQYTTWFPHSLVKLPDNVTNEEGAMAEPFAVGLHAIQVSQVKPNDRVLILGGGIIGMSCAEWARTFGASEILSLIHISEPTRRS